LYNVRCSLTRDNPHSFTQQEGIKDAVLQQAILQRRALVHKSLRQGTGRSVQRAKFELNVVLRTPVQPSPEPVADGYDKYQTSTQQAGADGDLSPFNFGGRATKALSPMEGVPERLEFSGVVAEGKKRGSQQLMPPPPPVAAGDAGDAPNDDADAFDFGYDDYGGGDDDYGWIDDPQPPLNDPLPGREACNPDGVIAPKRKRIVMNPGSRLRGELRRKSLANDANVGLQEVAGGLRRSTRRSQEPLKWWLNEKKVMSRRKYKAMPTVAAVITDPNPASPWRTVEDPTGARQDKTKVKGPPKKKGPKKGVKQVLATKEATARTPPLKQKQTANDDAVDVDAAEAAEVLDVVDVVHIAEDANDDEMTEDDDTLMIGSIANNDDDLSDVAVPLGTKRKSEGKATSNSQKSSKSTRKSTKSMGTIPEDGTGVASPSNADSVTDDVGDDEIIIGRASVRRGSRGSRGSSAHAAQSETIGDEATLNMQAEPSTATTVDQGHDGDLEETDNIEGIEGIENANANKKQTARSSDVSGSPSKEPARRSARNRRTVSST